MDDDFRSMLTTELATLTPPPIGDLVTASTKAGRRHRTARRLGTGGIAVIAALALTAGAIGIDNHATRRAASPAAAHTTLVPATPAGLLEILLPLLPSGTTSAYAQATDELGIQTYLDDGSGPGMIRVDVSAGPPSTDPGPIPTNPGIHTDPLRQLPGGSVAMIEHIPSNCVERTSVYVKHPNGVLVGIYIASCLAWNGTANLPGPQTLTVDRAIAIANDPRWGIRIDKSLVDAGAARFPHLPHFG